MNAASEESSESSGGSGGGGGATADPIPAAATVAAGVGVAAVAGAAAVGSTNFMAVFLQNLMNFFRDVFGDNLVSRIDGFEQRRRILIATLVTARVGLFHEIEIVALVVGTVLYALAFIIAGRMFFSPELFALYFITAGIAITAHEVGHHYFAYTRKITTEIQIWVVGLVLMFITGILAGVVFAKPCRQIISDAHKADKKHIGRVMLFGPVISIVLAGVFFGISLLGGEYAQIGRIGFLVNMPLAIISLMPVAPWEGRDVYEYHKSLWAAIFFPILVVYFLFLII